MTAYLMYLPQRTDMFSAARAWFEDATVRSDASAFAGANQLVGARFRGVTKKSDGHDTVSEWTISGYRIIGGYPIHNSTRQHIFVVLAQDPEADNSVIEAWVTAVSRHWGGSCVRVAAPAFDASHADIGAWVAAMHEAITDDMRFTPDPLEKIASTLYSPTLLEATRAAAFLQHAGLRVAPTRPWEDGISYTVVGDTQYDGSISLSLTRIIEEPLALRALEWREYGPFAYTLTWIPEPTLAVGAGQEGDHDMLYVMTRKRIVPTVQLITSRLTEACTGTVLSADGFIRLPSQ